jgi:hypothetical protein
MKKRRNKRVRQRSVVIEPYLEELRRSKVPRSAIKQAKAAMLILLLGR